MPSSSQQLSHALKAQRLSLTRARQLVYKRLSQNEPLTMQQLVDACLPQIDRASVYRTVKLFERLGIVQRLQIGWKYKLELSNAFQDHHHHLSCTNCGKIIPLDEDPQLERRLIAMASAQNFSAEDHQLEIRGLCGACKTKKPEPELGFVGSLTLPTH